VLNDRLRTIWIYFRESEFYTRRGQLRQWWISFNRLTPIRLPARTGEWQPRRSRCGKSLDSRSWVCVEWVEEMRRRGAMWKSESDGEREVPRGTALTWLVTWAGGPRHVGRQVEVAINQPCRGHRPENGEMLLRNIPGTVPVIWTFQERSVACRGTLVDLGDYPGTHITPLDWWC